MIQCWCCDWPYASPLCERRSAGALHLSSESDRRLFVGVVFVRIVFVGVVVVGVVFVVGVVDDFVLGIVFVIAVSVRIIALRRRGGQERLVVVVAVVVVAVVGRVGVAGVGRRGERLVVGAGVGSFVARLFRRLGSEGDGAGLFFFRGAGEADRLALVLALGELAGLALFAPRVTIATSALATATFARLAWLAATFARLAASGVARFAWLASAITPAIAARLVTRTLFDA